MHILNCEHPHFVINPSTGEKVRVRCGKCAICRNARSKKWISKLLAESQSHRYAFMVNLTYDNSHLPRLVEDGKGNLVFGNRNSDLCIPFTELTDLMVSYYRGFYSDKFFSDDPDEDKLIRQSKVFAGVEKDYLYLKSRLSHPLGLPCVCPEDISLFNKRLNKHIHDNYTHSYENFRFFLCHEYGPSTFRPHAHAIYFFSSRFIAENFSKILLSTWQNGNSSCTCIFSKGGFNYVAQYVNMLTHLPSFYSHPKIRQRHQFSKCPPLGSLELSRQELPELYDGLSTTRTIWDSSSSRYITIPVDTPFKNRYFPKFESYSGVPDFDRVPLYRCTEIFPSGDFGQFIDAVYKLEFALSSNRYLPNPPERCVLQHFRDINFNSKDSRKVELKLYKYYRVSKRFCLLRESLNTSSEWLYNKIDSFYKKLDYERLKDFYTFQENYINSSIDKSTALMDLVGMYPDLVDYFTRWSKINFDVEEPNYMYLTALESFGLDYTSLLDYDIFSSVDFRTSKQVANKIYKDTHKRHDINNYRYSQIFNNSDSELQKIILAYAT